MKNLFALILLAASLNVQAQALVTKAGYVACDSKSTSDLATKYIAAGNEGGIRRMVAEQVCIITPDGWPLVLLDHNFLSNSEYVVKGTDIHLWMPHDATQHQ